MVWGKQQTEELTMERMLYIFFQSKVIRNK